MPAARRFPVAAAFVGTSAVLLAGLCFSVPTAHAAEGTIVEGELEADQSPAGADETHYPAATPTPVSGDGSNGLVHARVLV